MHSGLPSDAEINNFADINQHKSVIADDLMGSLTQSNVIFCICKHSRTMNLNTHYMINMRNPRDVSTMKVLGRQLGIENALHEAYTDMHKMPYSYSVTYQHPSSDEQYKLLTNICRSPTKYNDMHI